MYQYGSFIPQLPQIQMPQQPIQPVQPVQPALQQQEVVKVNGKNGAEAFQMAPNSSAILLDSSAPLIWLCTTDGAGYKSVTPYSITPYKEAPPIDVNNLEQRISKLEEIIHDGQYAKQSNYSDVKSKNGFKSEHKTESGTAS